MTDNILKLFRVIWLIGSVVLVALVAREQVGFYTSAVRTGRSFDFDQFHRQGHNIVRTPWILTSYFVLLASALMYLLGPGRGELATPEGKWLTSGLLFSMVVYAYLLIIP
jgi:hypothetical protein